MNLMKIKIWLMISVVILFMFFTHTPVLADESSSSAEFNPNVVFWPLAAGKTVDDNLFFLKELKENLRGLIIFGSMQKVSYQVTLGTKRLLEVDKLLQQKKIDVGLKTLDKASSQFTAALGNVEKTKKESMPAKIKLNIIDQLQKSREYGKILQNKGDENIKQKLDYIDKQEEKILNILY